MVVVKKQSPEHLNYVTATAQNSLRTIIKMIFKIYIHTLGKKKPTTKIKEVFLTLQLHV